MSGFLAILMCLMFSPALQGQEPGFHQFAYPGYQDTPLIPGSTFKVHQADRPLPLRIKPPVRVESLGTPAPSDAVVLFDGSSPAAFQGAAWKIKDGVLVAGKGNLLTKSAFGDCQLHLEWRTPDPPRGEASNMGNSGIFIMTLYELQIYDSYSAKIYADGGAAAIYGQTPPLVNVTRKPGQWQSYDIIFEAPVFQEGTLASAARMTVLHNGVLAQNNTQVLGPTSHRTSRPYKVHAAQLPIMLQGHGSPVAFRNIWIREL